MNFVNNNFVGKTFKVLLVNVIGKWTGGVVAPGQSNNKPAQGGAQQAAATASPSPTASAHATAQHSPVPSPTATTSVANGTVLGKMKTTKGSVLGAFTKESAEIELKDGKKYFVDDTLNVPQDKPIVASAVSAKKVTTTTDWIGMIVGSLMLASTAGLIFKKVQKMRNK
jgi:hypothetical protein